MVNKILVTKPHLPQLQELDPFLKKIWKTKILTNCGPYHNKLEKLLCKFLNVQNVSLVNNATTGLITSLYVLDLYGKDIITTPYSFIATTHALKFANCKPIFVDIEPNGFNIDPKKIEASITKKTGAILAIHCYGIPCNINEIKKIAKKNNLKVIYDAAHAFDSTYNNKSVLNHGDISVLSFHATKIFNTFEGGALVCKTKLIKKKIDSFKNFGYENETTISSFGLNAKMSEFNAVIGILQLKRIKKIREKLLKIKKAYLENLREIKGLILPQLTYENIKNLSYFPILIEKNFFCGRDNFYDKLKKNEIFSRRYFYPLITNFYPYKKYHSSELKNANKISKNILTLPLYSDMTKFELLKIINTIKKVERVK